MATGLENILERATMGASDGAPPGTINVTLTGKNVMTLEEFKSNTQDIQSVELSLMENAIIT